MKCSNCGKVLEGKHKFCPSCGTKLEVKEEKKAVHSRQSKQSSKKVPTLLKWGIGFIVVLAIGLFTYFQMNSAEAYNQAIDDGEAALLIEEYEEAEAHFKIAMEEQADDDVATNLFNQTQLYNEANRLFEEGDLTSALEKANEAVDFEIDIPASQALATKISDLTEQIEGIESAFSEFTADYEKAESLFEEGQSEESVAVLEDLLENDALNETHYSDIKTEVESLYETVTDDINRQVAEAEATEEAARLKEEEERAEAEAAETVETEETQNSDRSLSDYQMLDVEYARIIDMIGYPESPTVYASKRPAGTPVAAGYEETVVFPQDVTFLTGEYTAHGMIVYASHGDGHITIYPVPSHWHQDDQSDEGYQEYAQEILDNAYKVYVEPGDEQEIINRIENTQFVYE